MSKNDLTYGQVAGRFSLNNVQLSVYEFLDNSGKSVKGLGLLGLGLMPMVVEFRAILARDDVKSLVDFLRAVLAHRLPASFAAPAGDRRTFRWQMRKFTSNWHDGGAFRGSMSLAAIPLGPLNTTWSRVAVTPKTLEDLAECLRSFYGLDA